MQNYLKPRGDCKILINKRDYNKLNGKATAKDEEKTGLTNGELSKFRSRFSFKEKQCGSAFNQIFWQYNLHWKQKTNIPPKIQE